MKNIVFKTGLFLLTAAMIIVSCQKVKYDYIDGITPDERANLFMEDVRNTLVNGTGWVGFMYAPKTESGYTFYVEFIDKNRVLMYSDFVDSMMVKGKESSYSLRNVSTPSLIFDTYNYIHVPADPDGKINGGINGAGLSSDYEFSILSHNQDTIQLVGNLNGSRMTLVKIDAEHKSKLPNGEFMASINKFRSYLTGNKNSYIELPDGKLMGLNFSDAAKSVSYSVQEEDGTVSASSAPYFYSVLGANMLNDLKYEGISIVTAVIEDGKMRLTDLEGRTYLVKQSNHPLTQLSASFGAQRTYSKLHIAGDKLPSGVTSEYTKVFNQIVAKVRNGGYSIQGMDISFINSTDMQIHLDITSIVSQKVHYAEAMFAYTREGNTITLSDYRPTDGVGYWKRLEGELTDLWSYFNNNSFKIDWVESSGTDVLGGFYPVSNPENFIYGILQ